MRVDVKINENCSFMRVLIHPIQSPQMARLEADDMTDALICLKLLVMLNINGWFYGTCENSGKIEIIEISKLYIDMQKRVTIEFSGVILINTNCRVLNHAFIDLTCWHTCEFWETVCLQRTLYSSKHCIKCPAIICYLLFPITEKRKNDYFDVFFTAWHHRLVNWFSLYISHDEYGTLLFCTSHPALYG